MLMSELQSDDIAGMRRKNLQFYKYQPKQWEGEIGKEKKKGRTEEKQGTTSNK